VLAEARDKALPSRRSWLAAHHAASWAEHIRSAFGEWQRRAQARILALALREVMLGRVSMHVLGLHALWTGGLVSRREIVTARGPHLRWTREEDALLRQWYAKLSWPALEQMLPGHSHKAIQQRAYEFRLARSRYADHEGVPPVVVPAREVANVMAEYGFPLSTSGEATMAVGAGGG
jgi:hypothetical protein